ncbi:Splicing factor [Gamsiella multidivaricata]|nr:Splicing factor [Gamsiella multidivaricata]
MSNADSLSDVEFDMDGVEMTEEVSQETIEAIATLTTSLESNPSQYELHTQLIALLKSASLLEELRKARRAMNALYPLSEELWVDWIGDEQNMATQEEEKQHVLDLYEKATAEYLSVRIWKSYLEYAVQEFRESMEHPDNESVVSKEYLTNLFKKADKLTGYHIPQSHLVWNVWKDFELEQLAAEDPPQPKDVSRVKAMFIDRVAIPHSELEDTFSSLSSFITQYDGENYENTMVHCNKIASVTRNALSEIEGYEQQLVSTNNGLEAFMSYLTHELRKNKEQFTRIRTLYERAVAVHCLVPALWIDYVSFLMSTSHQKKEHDLTPAEVLDVARRATQNCPWSGDIWENRTLLLETYLKPEDEISDGYNTVRKAFEYALTVLEAAGGDPYCKLERLWIELESSALGNHEKARELWKSIESKQKTLSDFWIAQAEMEKKLKNDKGARQVYARSCQIATSLDWPEKVFEAWLMFERESGDLVTYKDALLRSRAAMKGVEAFRAQSTQEISNAYADQTAYAVVQPSEPVMATQGQVENEGAQEGSKKRKMSAQNNEPAAKILKTEPDQHKTKDAKPLNISAGRHEDTCFVVNFPLDMSEKKLTELFQEYGTVLRCTIPPPRSGEIKKRSFAYVQFSSPEEAHAALALDGRDVGQRRGLSVRISDTNQKTRGIEGEPPLPRVSRHEVHISGITNELKEEELEKLVALYAQPTSVFIQRVAQSKGKPWANIKFETEEDADKALALDGTMFHGKELSVKRRVFQKATAGGEEGLSRKERRRLAAEKKQQAEKDVDQEESKDGEGAPSTSRQQKQSAAESSSMDQDTSPAASTLKESKKPTATLTSMQPRSMAPRSLQPRNLKPTSHTRPPARAFKPASTTTTTNIASTAEATQDGGEVASVPVSAPKSNAEFRALMLSGALKKKNP